MLRELHLRNYALLQDLTLDFSPGLNVLTGPSGAGKSIVVEALGLLLGARADAREIGPWGEQAEVSARVAGTPAAAALLAAGGLPESDDLILRRVVGAGESRAWCNQSPVSLAFLKQLGALLVDVHGQHEHQSLLFPENYPGILDRCGKHDAALTAWRTAYENYRVSRRQHDTFREAARVGSEAFDLYRYQLKEIDEARLQPGEDESLRAERERLRHGEAIRAALAAAREALGADEGGALDRLAAADAALAGIEAVYPEAGAWLAALRESQAALDEARRGLRSAAEGMTDDPRRLEEVEARFYLLARLQKKYGATTDAILARRSELAGKLLAAEDYDGELARRAAELAAAERGAAAAAAKLTAARTRAGAELSAAVGKELKLLGLEAAEFAVAVLPRGDGWDAGGADLVQFQFTANPGHPAQPLDKVASGGEISRVMLAIKGALAGDSPVPTMIFDEIDSGISGPVAAQVADRLAAAARQQQIVCITHLPVIAAAGERHFRVGKATVEGKTATTLEVLEGEARVDEVAILSARGLTAIARDHARELLRAGKWGGKFARHATWKRSAKGKNPGSGGR